MKSPSLVRDVPLPQDAAAWQRSLSEQLLLGALREQDNARDAVEARERAQFLARASRDLSMSLDESETRDTVRRFTLPRPGTWCIVDVVESNGAIRRLPVEHPDASKQELARSLEQLWPSEPATNLPPPSTVLGEESGAALLLAAHGPANLRILRQIGFGSLLVVPLIVRARVQGGMTFLSPPGDPPFTSEEISLAVDLAGRCALALDNARLYHEADTLRMVAQMANQSKSQFLGSMSHELRTPLNAIGGFAELIDLGIQGPVTAEQHDALGRIKANQEHLLVLITEILNFARIESGRVEYHNAEVSIPKTLSAVVDMLSGAIFDAGMTVEGPNPEPAAVAWADPDRVRQILVNLLMNAIKYGSVKGGTITLSCACEGDVVIVRVTDTGRGIPEARLESIFEPFVQLTAGLTERRGGVGLGLAISRDLARAMDGDLTVESMVGFGSRFILTLLRARSK